MKKYGEALKAQRLLCGKSVLEVQKETGISNQNLFRWEKNEVLPNIDFCVKLADCYGVTLDELVGREVKNPSRGDSSLRSE